MSLIDDALKRAQAADEKAAGKPSNRPWIPTPMPDAGLARRRSVLRWLGIAVAAGVVAAAAVVVLRRAASSGPPVPARDGKGDGRSAAAGVAAPTSPTPLQFVVAVATPTTPVPASLQAPRPRPTRAPTPPSSGEAAAEAPAPAPIAKPSGPIANGRTYAGSVALGGGAKIELGGIVWSETEPRALLNDHVLATDSYVEGYRVAKIEEDRVALEKDGVTIYVTVK